MCISEAKKSVVTFVQESAVRAIIFTAPKVLSLSNYILYQKKLCQKKRGALLDLPYLKSKAPLINTAVFIVCSYFLYGWIIL